MSKKWIAAIAAVVTSGAMVACAPSDASNQKTVAVVTAAVPVQTQGAAALKLAVAPEGNEARYRVREQLLGLDFPNDAVGVTRGITGTIAFDAKGNVIPGESRIVVDVTALKSDKERRDGYLQRRTLETEQYPTVALVPKTIRGVSLPLPTSGSRAIELVGDLTVRGVTRPTTWRGEAKFEGEKITGQIATTFTFTDLELTKPSVRSVLSVEDDIKLEYEFTLVPQP